MLPKLVRDGVPALIVKDGKIPICEFVDDYDVEPYIFNKIKEEVAELQYECGMAEQDREKILEEFADIYEVLNKLAKVYNIEPEDIAEAQFKKHKKSGAFNSNIILTDIILGGKGE